jgi:hypothetical protein
MVSFGGGEKYLLSVFGDGTKGMAYLRSIGIRIRVALPDPAPFDPGVQALSIARFEPDGPSCMSGSREGFSVACGKFGSLLSAPAL